MLCMILGSIQPSEDLFMIYHHMYQVRHVPYRRLLDVTAAEGEALQRVLCKRVVPARGA